MQLINGAKAIVVGGNLAVDSKCKLQAACCAVVDLVQKITDEEADAEVEDECAMPVALKKKTKPVAEKKAEQAAEAVLKKPEQDSEPANQSQAGTLMDPSQSQGTTLSMRPPWTTDSQPDSRMAEFAEIVSEPAGSEPDGSEPGTQL